MSSISKEPTTRPRSNARRVAAMTAAKGTVPKATAKPARATPPRKPRPIPREVRAAAAALAALGDPVRLEMLGMLAECGEHSVLTLDAIASRFGLDAAIVTDHIAALRKPGWILAVRSSDGWSYRATPAGDTARLRAIEFGREV